MKGGTEDYLVASVYYYASVMKTAQAAGILAMRKTGNTMRRLPQGSGKAVLEEYFSPKGTAGGGYADRLSDLPEIWDLALEGKTDRRSEGAAQKGLL